MDERERFAATVQELFRRGDWRSMVRQCHDHPERSRLLWVFPSEDNFRFIEASLAKLKCDRVLSIGCGSGLLEWMLGRALGKPVIGVELDGTWWRSRYAPPAFIDLHLASAALDQDAATLALLGRSASTAILFCYFNDRAAFEGYLRRFAGRVLLVLGPAKPGVHAEPKPFDDVGPGWTLWDSREVRDSKDFIAIYVKSRE